MTFEISVKAIGALQFRKLSRQIEVAGMQLSLDMGTLSEITNRVLSERFQLRCGFPCVVSPFPQNNRIACFIST